jgi:hypothetical protein
MDATASPVVLAQYQFPGNPGSLVPTVVNPLVTASNVTFPSPSIAQQFTGVAATGLLGIRPGAGNNNQGNTTDPTDPGFYQFTIGQVGQGYMNLDKLIFDVGRRNTTQSNYGFVVRSSVDNFDASIFEFSQNISTILPSLSNVPIPLTDPAFQGVAGPIDFRIYSWAFQPQMNVLNVGYDNLTLTGERFIPEIDAAAGAGSLSLVLGVLALLRERRRFATAK